MARSLSRVLEEMEASADIEVTAPRDREVRIRIELGEQTIEVAVLRAGTGRPASAAARI